MQQAQEGAMSAGSEISRAKMVRKIVLIVHWLSIVTDYI